jgi:hypothetical protein
MRAGNGVARERTSVASNEHRERRPRDPVPAGRSDGREPPSRCSRRVSSGRAAAVDRSAETVHVVQTVHNGTNTWTFVRVYTGAGVVE